MHLKHKKQVVFSACFVLFRYGFGHSGSAEGLEIQTFLFVLLKEDEDCYQSDQRSEVTLRECCQSCHLCFSLYISRAYHMLQSTHPDYKKIWRPANKILPSDTVTCPDTLQSELQVGFPGILQYPSKVHRLFMS